MTTITVREYAQLTTAYIGDQTLDKVHISPATFKDICALNNNRQKGNAPLIKIHNDHILSVCNYVGVIQTTRGICIEILPKTSENNSRASVEHERTLLVKMLKTVFDLPYQKNEFTNLRRFTNVLQEWVIHQFLKELYILYKKGLLFAYNYVSEEKPFLRGKLDIGKQVMQAPQRMHLLHTRHTVFTIDRPEHRLLRSALDRCLAVTQEVENIRLARPLSTLFTDIHSSSSVAADFHQWNSSRHMAHYQAIRPWCELILGLEMPFTLAGEWRGISMLFPMEKLFEKYVGKCLRRRLITGASLSEQISRRHLCTMETRPCFALRPDLFIAVGEKHFLLDIKWKKLSHEKNKNWGISQQDFYQLFAYGHQYLQGTGDVALIYPACKTFPSINVPFQFSETLNLWLLAFDLDKDILRMPSACPIKQAFVFS